MPRHNYGDDSNRDREDSRKSENKFVFDTSTKKSEELTDPIKCPMCGRNLQCPRNKDYEAFAAGVNRKCLTSSDPICIKASQNSGNVSYITRIKQEVARSSREA